MNRQAGPPVVAFVVAGILEEWLDPLGLTLDDFCDAMVGTWLFNYVGALHAQGVRTTVIATARVSQTVNRVHRPTGASIWLLPPSPAAARRVAALERLPLPRPIRRRLQHLATDLLSTPSDAIADVLRREEVGAVVVQDYESARFDVLVSLAHGLALPVFGTFTGNVPQSWFHRPRRLRSMRRATGFVICAQSEIERVQATYGVTADRLRKIYYPVDRSVWFPEDRNSAREALGLDGDATIAIYHGMIHMNVKGLDILLEAWDRLSGSGPRANRRLLILGDGIDAAALGERIRVRARDDITFVNQWHHDRALIRRYLSAADLYVFPTRVDAFGIAVTEAMACGLPVVAASGRGMADILPEGENSGGIVVPSGDTEAFAAALQRMMEDRAFRERVAANAKRRLSDPAFGPEVGLALKKFLLA